MRSWMLAFLAGASLAVTAAPAEAAWKSYLVKDLGFSFIMPCEPKSDIGTYRGGVAGPRQTMIFRCVDDNIEYKATVMSFAQAAADGATLLGEREYMFQDGKDVRMDVFGRVEPGKDSVYGRKIVIDLPEKKGRTTGAFYFTKGKMYVLEATVLPANGDFESPDPGRFIDSIVFVLSRTEPGAIELQAPKPE
jgi:hypothetical protein